MTAAPSRHRLFTIFAPLARLAARLQAAGGVHLAVSVVLVQGTAYVAQLVVAQLLGPGAFGTVRAVEAIVASALTLAQCGLPSLAIRGVVGLDDNARDAMVRQLLLAGLITSTLVLAALEAGAPWLAPGAGAPWLRVLAPTLLMAVTGRIAVGVLQGVRRVQDASFASAAASVLGTLGVITAASRYGVAGWAGGRYVAESLMALALVLTLRTSLMHGGAWRLPSVSIFRDGFTISFALLLRSVLDNLVVPLLLWLGVSPSEAGHFGLGALMAFPVLLLPGVVGNLVIPRFVLMLDQPTELRRLLVRSVIGSTATALALVAVFAILGPLVIRWALPAYRESIEILLLLLVATPMRAAPIAMGGLLLAAQDLRSPVVINAACVVILTALAAWWIPLFGARGGALAIIITEMASLSGYALASSRVLRSRGGA